MASFGLCKLTAYNSDSDSDSSDNDSFPSDEVAPPKRARLQTNEPPPTNLSSRERPADKHTCAQKSSEKPQLRLPSVPADVLRMFPNTDGKPNDDPSLHMGRTRSFPHVRGNWASYVYIKCPEDSEIVIEIEKHICDTVEAIKMEEPLHLVREKHLSLSRTLPLRHHWIEPFVENLKNLMSYCKSFHLYFGEFEVYTNDEKSRTFISLKVITSNNLLELVEKCDESLTDFQLEPYYKNPSFHVSFAWMLGDMNAWAKDNLLPVLNKKWICAVDSDPTLQFIPVNAVDFKTGNQLYRFNLGSSSEIV